MRRLVLFLVAGAVLAQAPPTEAPSAEIPTLKSIGTMSQLMVDFIFPVSNEIFYVGREENKTDKDWFDLQKNAMILGEAANILMAPNRARDKDQWMRDAKLLWDVGDKAYKAAKVRDLPALEALNNDLYEACQSCHEHYRPGYKRRP